MAAQLLVISLFLDDAGNLLSLLIGGDGIQVDKFLQRSVTEWLAP